MMHKAEVKFDKIEANSTKVMQKLAKLKQNFQK
jgi:hypothetical protein